MLPKSLQYTNRAYPVREVPRELGDGLAPVSSGLLADQLDVQEGPLSRAVEVTAGGPSHDARRHVGHNVLLATDREVYVPLPHGLRAHLQSCLW